MSGGDTLYLTLMGKSIQQDSDSTQELSFNSIVRKSDKQVVTIQNPDDKEWHINPTISSENEKSKGYFQGKGTLNIPAKGSAQYEIIYTPLTMTKEENDFHKGSLFFPQPNGTALLYKLNGQAKEPDCEEELAREVKSKKNTFIVIPIRNWLKTAQRFKVSWEVEGGQDDTTFIRGANTFDVAGDSTKDYKLNFLTYKAAQTKVVITLKNEQSSEYMFYKINISSTEPDLIEELELASPVRESVSRIIAIENPTDQEVEIPKNQWVMANEYLDIQPEVLRIPPKSERGFEVYYRPLIASEQTCDLELKSPVLGNFKYKLVLKGLVPSTQKSMAFKCSLGVETVQSFKFHHFMKKATNYAVKIEKLEAAGPVQDFKADVAQV
jgi:hydrocephalus-inducing protein